MDKDHFSSLVAKWQRDSFDKTLSEIEMHPAYSELVRAGDEVLPLALNELISDPHPFIGWLSLLTAITGSDPAAGCFDVRAAARKWKAWARKQQLL